MNMPIHKLNFVYNLLKFDSQENTVLTFQARNSILNILEFLVHILWLFLAFDSLP